MRRRTRCRLRFKLALGSAQLLVLGHVHEGALHGGENGRLCTAPHLLLRLRVGVGELLVELGARVGEFLATGRELLLRRLLLLGQLALAACHLALAFRDGVLRAREPLFGLGELLLGRLPLFVDRLGGISANGRGAGVFALLPNGVCLVLHLVDEVLVRIPVARQLARALHSQVGHGERIRVLHRVAGEEERILHRGARAERHRVLIGVHVHGIADGARDDVDAAGEDLG